METKNNIMIPAYLRNKKVIASVSGLVLLIVSLSIFSLKINPSISSITITTPSPTPFVIRSTMQFDPQSVTVKANQQFKLHVMIDAKNTVINGVDSIVMFDPEYVKPLSVTDSTDDSEFYLLRKQIEKDSILITSAKSQFTKTPTSTMSVATISFKALKTGTTAVSFKVQPGTTKASTIIKAEGSTNILDQTGQSAITIN